MNSAEQYSTALQTLHLVHISILLESGCACLCVCIDMYDFAVFCLLTRYVLSHAELILCFSHPCDYLRCATCVFKPCPCSLSLLPWCTSFLMFLSVCLQWLICLWFWQWIFAWTLSTSFTWFLTTVFLTAEIACLRDFIPLPRPYFHLGPQV